MDGVSFVVEDRVRDRVDRGIDLLRVFELVVLLNVRLLDTVTEIQ